MAYSILINTCDSYEDCWDPFFQLFKLYWPDCTGKIYLNTEYKDYSYPGLDIVPIRGCVKHGFPRNKRATWSQCLKWALDEIDDDVLLYMQEDYFLNAPVDEKMFEHFLDTIQQHPQILCIHLTPGIPALKSSEYSYLYHSDNNFFSYLSCQAALWHKNIILSLIREQETAWNFEWWGSKRAKYMGLDFLTVGPDLVRVDGYQIIPYIFTGIIGGRWYRPVTELFAKHHINVDFSKRGYYEDTAPSLKKRIQTKLSIWRWKSVFEILRMKYLQ
jgi:hypothetical protein